MTGSVGSLEDRSEEQLLKRNLLEIVREWLGNCLRGLLLVFLVFLIWQWTAVQGSLAELILGTRIVWGVLNDYKDAFGSIQSIITAMGIVAAGWWSWRLFIKNRLGYPRAALSQAVDVLAMPAAKLLVRVKLTIRNEGEVLLSVDEGCTMIQQLKPWPEEFPKQDPNTLELLWPKIAKKTLRKPYFIEPKESETIPMDFVVDDCWETVLVYSHITNFTTRKNIGWPVDMIVDLTKAKKESEQERPMSNGDGTPDKKQSERKTDPPIVRDPVRRIQEQVERKTDPPPAKSPKKGN